MFYMLVPLDAEPSSQDALGGGPKAAGNMDESQASVEEELFDDEAFDGAGLNEVGENPMPKDEDMDGDQTPFGYDAEEVMARVSRGAEQDELHGAATPTGDHPEAPHSSPTRPSSQQPGDVRKKYRVLDPKSAKAMEERSLIPNAFTSKDSFTYMFSQYKGAWSRLTKATHGIQSGKVHDILTLTDQRMSLVKEEMPRWSEPMVRLGAAAVHMYNRRLNDLSERDHVHLLWMCTGEYMMRVHEGGQLWVYQPDMGYWKAFEGLPPPHFFEVIRQFFVMLEGIFRNFKGHVQRDDKSVLKAMDGVVSGKSFHDILHLCESACAWNKGNHLLKRETTKKLAAAQAAPPDGAAPDEVPGLDADFDDELEKALFDDNAAPSAATFGEGHAPAAAIAGVSQGAPEDAAAEASKGAAAGSKPDGNKPVQPWYIVVAQSISRFSPGLIKKLEHSRIIPFVSEWCQTPKLPKKGCAYKDCIVMYDVNDKAVTYLEDVKDEEG